MEELNEVEILSKFNQLLKDLPERKTLSKIKTFNVSIEIFNGNYDELLEQLVRHNTPEFYMSLRSQGKEKLHKYQREISRYLHNYFASAVSLIDHTRVHHKELYKENSRFLDYQNEIDARFVNNPLSSFVKDLRQYFQHYKIPMMSSSISINKDDKDFTVKLLLSLEELMNFSGWNSFSKKFINEQGKSIDLIAVVLEYHLLIKDFYEWFGQRQYDIHKQDREKVDELEQAIWALSVNVFLKQLVSKPWNLDDLIKGLSRFIDPNNLNEVTNLTVSDLEKVKKLIELINGFYSIDKELKNKIISTCQER